MAITQIIGNVEETPRANDYGYFNFRVLEPTPPNHPRMKGEQAYDIDAPPFFDKFLPKLAGGSAVVCLCEEYKSSGVSKQGYPFTRTRYHLKDVFFAPLDRRKEVRREQVDELRREASEPRQVTHQQAKQNGYQPNEADTDYPF